MSNDKLYRAACDGKEDEVVRLIETPEGLAGLEWTVRAAAALLSRPPAVAPAHASLRPPAASLRRGACSGPSSCHRLAPRVGRGHPGDGLRRRWRPGRGTTGRWCGRGWRWLGRAPRGRGGRAGHYFC
eukprot:2793683-Prymnesium_polylepis.1